MAKEKRSFIIGEVAHVIFIALVGLGVYFTSFYNYLLFHSVVELFSILVGFTIFIFVWLNKNKIDNHFFLFTGIAFLFFSIIDTIHTLVYQGMNIFEGFAPNLSTSLWIAARFLQALTFVIAPLFIKRKVRSSLVIAGYSIITVFLFLSIFLWKIFPECYIEGVGLTSFKIISEYVISGMLALSIVFIVLQREKFEKKIMVLLISAIVFSIFSEVSFTQYISVYGFFNTLGHIFKIFAFYSFFRAILIIGLSRPFDLLYKSVTDSEKKYRTLFTNAKDSIFLIKHEDNGELGNFLEVNNTACEKFGYSREEFLCMTPSNIDMKGKESIIDIVKNIEELGQFTYEREYRTKQGKIIPLEISSHIFMMYKHRVQLSIARDISTRKLIAQQEKFASIGKLAGGVAHYFNNMLAVISGAADLIKIETKDKRLTDLLNLVSKQSMRGGQLVKQVLDFSGKSSHFERPIEIADFMIEISQMLKLILPDNIIIKLTTEELNVKIDESQLQQVLLNLILNSKDAMTEGGEILIDISSVSNEEVEDFEIKKIEKNNYMHLQVKDTGSGIKEEILGEIFEPFFTTKSIGEGVGVGLSQVYGIVRQYSGHINVESKEDEGTTMHLYFPLVAGEAKVKEEYEAKILEDGGKILLVEDDENVREITKQMIQTQGFDVVTASNGMEALE
ncbi:MAG: MASE3 domain-containing protein, partial [Candidatus Heimdallarchaeota archaeon]